MKRRVLAEHTFDLADDTGIGVILGCDRPEVGFVRHGRRGGELVLGHRCVDRLASDHDDLVVAGQLAGSADQVLKL